MKIVGTGSCLPQRVVSNDDLAAIMDTSDEWISSRTGIRNRHIATTETTTSKKRKKGNINLIFI